MVTRKRNQWLDEGESDEVEEQGYDSEAQEERRTDRTSKRRRLSHGPPEQNHSPDEPGQDNVASLDDDDYSGDEEKKSAQEESANTNGDAPSIVHQQSALNEAPSKLKKPKKDQRSAIEISKPSELPAEDVQNGQRRILKPLSKHAAPPSKSGVVYISRVPPFMKPHTLKSYLSPFGEIGRIFLTPEDPQSHRARVRSGGNKKRSFTDGWVEFLHKRDAKIVAETLNTQIIGGKKGGFYHDDVWNIKYLKGFKWSHLTEQIANENAERAARLRQEIGQTTKENKRFIQNVERAKMLEGVKAKKRQKQEGISDKDGQDDAGIEPPTSTRSDHFRKHFRQKGVKSKSNKQQGPEGQNDEVQRVLSKIF